MLLLANFFSVYVEFFSSTFKSFLSIVSVTVVALSSGSDFRIFNMHYFHHNIDLKFVYNNDNGNVFTILIFGK